MMSEYFTLFAKYGMSIFSDDQSYANAETKRPNRMELYPRILFKVGYFFSRVTAPWPDTAISVCPFFHFPAFLQVAVLLLDGMASQSILPITVSGSDI
jgi:hypothetical protein